MSSNSFRRLLGLGLMAMYLCGVAGGVPLAFAEEEGEGEDEDGAEPDDAGAAEPVSTTAPTRADRKNEKSLSLAMPSHVWLAFDQALWRAPAKGGASKKVGPLPAKSGAPTALLTNRSGDLLALEMDNAWWYSPTPHDAATLKWTKLPCQQAPTLLRHTAFCLVDRKANKWAQLQLPTQASKAALQVTAATTITLPANAQATQLENGDVVWVGKDAVYRAQGTDITKTRVVAKQPPIAHFSAAPDGSYALGHFQAVLRKTNTKLTNPLLFALRLDGIGGKRRSVRKGLPLAWSDDGAWALVQDEQDACIVAVAGGHFRCFAGHQGLDMSPSGEWILMRDAAGKLLRGQRSGTKIPPPTPMGTQAVDLALWDHR